MPAPGIQSKITSTIAGLKAKGLTETMVFSFVADVGESAYDPATGTFSTPTTTSSTVDVIVISRERSIGSGVNSAPKETLKIIVDKADVGELSSYDTATFNGANYSLETFVDNLYAVEMVLTKEIS